MAFSPTRRHRGSAEGNRTGPAGRDFLLLLAATLGTFSNYAPLLSVAPLWSAEGGSGYTAVGAATGVTMATTVGVQLCMSWLLKRVSLRRMLIIGSLLLGLPTFAYPVSAAMDWVLAVSAVRGAGFGMVAVAGSALVAELIPADSRGRAVGLYGIAVGLPQVACLPLGVWAAEHLGFTAVFVTAGALSVLAAPLAAAIRVPAPAGPGRPRPRSRTGPAQLRAVSRPFTVLITTACALGAVTSFLPLALAQPSSATPALFLLTGAVIVGRWVAGIVSDRSGVGRLMGPSVLACAAGMGGFGLAAANGAAALSGAAAVLYGLGFGALQNDTLVLMFQRSGPDGHGMASTLWNMAYDAGTGAGAVAVGLTSYALGIDGAFAAAATLILLVVPLAFRDARSGRLPDAAPAQNHPAETAARKPHGHAA
ncbi:putative MFS family arabinose efflux permease [Streptomyces sp. 840.1]|uniref:MFS transporter n=1 Tax=Streptomyces sp. 840.1 TaxID=2485152 RepID=UPI000F4A27D2|nr:MFS transporter [Streptomyces sp. 840.1]ROQ68821.1 putative MFS family arabinose efflux permease [Streptomyces sp. 840.1]